MHGPLGLDAQGGRRTATTHDQLVLAATQAPGDVHFEGRQAAGVLTHLPAVHKDERLGVHGPEACDESTSRGRPVGEEQPPPVPAAGRISPLLIVLAPVVTLPDAPFGDADGLPIAGWGLPDLLDGNEAPADAGVQFRAYLEWWKKDGTFGNSSLPWAGWQSATGAWERKLFLFPFPKGANPPYLVLQLKGAGRISFDSVLVTEPLAEPLRDGNVFNSSFEARPTMWQLGHGASIAPGGASDGRRCLKLEGEAEGDDPSASLSGITTEMGKRYELTFVAKAGGGSSETTGFQFFRVCTSWDRLVRDGRDFGSVSQRDGMSWQDCLASWQRRSLEFTAPEKPTSGMTITCQVRGPGAVFIDDLQLRQIERQVDPEPELELVVDRPWHRGSIYSTCPHDAIVGNVVVRAKAAARVTVSLQRDSAVPSDRQVSAVTAVPGGVPFKLRLTDLRPGDLALAAAALDREGRTLAEVAQTIRVLPPAPAEICTRPDNVLLVNGTPFFPIGLWWIPPDERAVHELSCAGFNFARMAAREDLLDAAASVGMMAMATIANDPPPAEDVDARRAWEDACRERIDSLRAHPALLGYYIVDEPLWGGHPLGPLVDAYTFHRGLDPYHPIWLNAAPRGTVRDLAKYNRACDITGADIYPVPEGGGHSELDDKTVSSVGKYTGIMRASVDDRKPVWMTLQAFSWPHLADRHAADAVYPSWEQSRFMAYDCVLHGATGIVYWGSHYIADPGFWDVLKRTASVLRDMSAVFVSPTVSPSPVKPSHDDIALLHKSCDGHHAIIAANEGKESPEATFSAPFVEGRLHVLFEDRTTTVSAGRFRDHFAPNAVHVYSTCPSPPPPLRPPAPLRSHLNGRSLMDITAELLATESYRGSANWVWAPGKSTVRDSACCARRVFELGAPPRSAILTLAADDE